MSTAEGERLRQDTAREENWKRWGPYLSERQWATVREDYSADGSNWTSFPYEHSLSRAYRWGEDGLLGFTDRECRLCLGVALWNHADTHLKERLFGLTNPEGNHGEDVKEVYFYLDATPTSSYVKSGYKYPQAAFPYEELRRANRERGLAGSEYELPDTGVFDQSKYFDVTSEYAKASPDDILWTLTVANRGPDAAPIAVLPSAWFRNTWSWGLAYDEGTWGKPEFRAAGPRAVSASHSSLGEFMLLAESAPTQWLFCENETNPATFGTSPVLKKRKRYKDGVHDFVVRGDAGAVTSTAGTKVAAHYRRTLAPGEELVLRLRLKRTPAVRADEFADFREVVADRTREADEFYADRLPGHLNPRETQVSRQAYAGLLHSNQFYHWVIPDWIHGDKLHPNSPEVVAGRAHLRDWRHLFSRDVLSTPDKWEYPAFFAWDTAFHMVALARIDPAFAKHQLSVLLREWYLHPNGQIPAYEYALSNVNPPVHAWACYEVYVRDGKRDIAFLESTFHKLMLNFTWWVNRQDPAGKGVFSGGFLGMDNIGVFDRSKPLPVAGYLEQADGTAWMGFYSTSMLQIALELAQHNPVYEDVASKFFEHYVAIDSSLNHIGGVGLWDEADGFYYDQLYNDGHATPLKLRGMIGFVPLFAVLAIDEGVIRSRLPQFAKRMDWFLTNRREQLDSIDNLACKNGKRLLSMPSHERMLRVLACLLDEGEFLSPFGVRSLSKKYDREPYRLELGGQSFTVRYEPGEMQSRDFGGNSNWRGPIWVPMNFLLIESLRQYARYHGDDLKVECPTGSGVRLTLTEVANELGRRVGSLMMGELDGRPAPDRGCYEKFAGDPHWAPGVLFPEYFDGDTGRGLGAIHQTGWTALVATLLEDCPDHQG